MENKYYTPNIEDLYIGYKCEIESNKIWYPETIEGISTKENIVECNGFDYYITKDLPNIRTPYLSIEDILGEKWQQVIENETNILFKKGESLCYLWKLNIPYIEIYPEEGKDTQYQGDCYSVNEFRKICKWSKI